MKEKTAGKIVIGAITLAVALVLWFFVWPMPIWGVATPVHAAFGWTVDSVYWVHIVDSVRTDSSGMIYSVTEWPDTNFDLSDGHIHQIRFYYWAPGIDSANWQFDFDKSYASVDYAQIADSVDGQLTVTHGSGSWQSGAGGTGSDTLIYYATDTGNNNRVEGVQITMYAVGGTQVGATQTTDGSGKTLWALNVNDTLLPITYGPHLYNWELPTLVFTGQTADSAMGYKTADPPAAATAPYVAAYFDGGAGFVDSTSGLMITRTNVTYYCQIVGAHAFADGSWGIVPQLQKKRPDSTGRVTFLVVANLFLTPPTSYYRFWYQSRDGTTRVRKTIRNFIVDSLPDPVNILQTTEVFPGNY